jgi:hypothetical protein
VIELQYAKLIINMGCGCAKSVKIKDYVFTEDEETLEEPSKPEPPIRSPNYASPRKLDRPYHARYKHNKDLLVAPLPISVTLYSLVSLKHISKYSV